MVTDIVVILDKPEVRKYRETSYNEGAVIEVTRQDNCFTIILWKNVH